MKKLFLLALLVLGAAVADAQTIDTAAVTDDETVTLDASPTAFDGEAVTSGVPLHRAIKQKFLEGGVVWMAPILLCLIIGLAIVIERALYLNLSAVNCRRLIEDVEQALDTGGVEAAKEVCRNTRGPVASIFYQGLERYGEGLEVVEKSVVSYGSVQMGLMESGLNWIALFIALAPMLGFLGTVVGMVEAFDAIQLAGDISPALVAGGIKVALLTTLAGLVVAIILQMFYSYIVSKIDSLVLAMEDSSISLIDILIRFGKRDAAR
ncbi:MAG: MotA/TolQ/ExbB proton channel family protein [Rikenellaceae bacterium]|jgi:biopolymer transport protein ExbB|nr:MotA/TolQ/ExbB proton channel family protein [Rikenellaceae bacterium]